MTAGKHVSEDTVVDKADLSASDVGAPNVHGVVEPATIKKITKLSAILTVLVSGLALFSDGYNAQIIGYMEPLFADLYKEGFTDGIATRLKNSYLIGEIFGMLFFGFIIDKIGRRTGVVFATLFLVLGIVLATAAHGFSELGLFWMMIVARGVAGFGAGGEYPVCGTSSAEASDETEHVRKRRGILVAVTTDFAIDLGFVIAGCVALVVLAAYNYKASVGVWRVCFGLGIVLPITLFFFRVRMIESTQYRKHAIKEKMPYGLILRRYWKPMLGTSLAWFMYDFVTYPFGLSSSTIITQLNPQGSLIQNIGLGTAVNCFYLPGCIVGGFLMDWIGRKQTMTLGFAVWAGMASPLPPFGQVLTLRAVMGFILGGALGPIQSVFPLFVVLYGIFNAAGEMGPGVATFLTSAESFPTPIRGHCLGLAAAVGKAGAAIGTQVFTPIQNSFESDFKGTQVLFLIGGAFAAVGGLIAWFLIPSRERDLESEDARFRAYLAEHGYDNDFGETMERNLKSTAFKV